MRYEFDSALFAEKLKEWIGDRPLRSVAEDVNMDFTCLSRYATCRRVPTADSLVNLCLHMKVKPEDFYFDNQTEPE